MVSKRLINLQKKIRTEVRKAQHSPNMHDYAYHTERFMRMEKRHYQISRPHQYYLIQEENGRILP